VGAGQSAAVPAWEERNEIKHPNLFFQEKVGPKELKKKKSLSGNPHYLLKLFFFRRFFFSLEKKKRQNKKLFPSLAFRQLKALVQ
jgi:hypothetical protein